jgi:hypothetical protein
MCLTHTRAAVSEDKTVKPKWNRKPAPPPTPQPAPVKHTAGYLSSFVFENQEALTEITRIAEETMNDFAQNNPNMFRTGQRRLIQCPTPWLDPLLQLMIEEAKQKVKFPLKSKCQVLHPSIVVAPAVGSRSSAHTRSIVHRDYDTIKLSGVYTFELFLDDIEQSQPQVRFWHESKLCPLDPRNPKRDINKFGLESTDIFGIRGTVYIWDSRILHQSLPNTTQERRRAVIWMAKSESNKNKVIEK